MLPAPIFILHHTYTTTFSCSDHSAEISAMIPKSAFCISVFTRAGLIISCKLCLWMQVRPETPSQQNPFSPGMDQGFFQLLHVSKQFAAAFIAQRWVSVGLGQRPDVGSLWRDNGNMLQMAEWDGEVCHELLQGCLQMLFGLVWERKRGGQSCHLWVTLAVQALCLQLWCISLKNKASVEWFLCQ